MLGKVKCIVGGQGQAAAKNAARQDDLPAKRFNLLCGSVAVDLALPLPVTGLDNELDRLALDNSLDIRSGHFESVYLFFWLWKAGEGEIWSTIDDLM